MQSGDWEHPARKHSGDGRGRLVAAWDEAQDDVAQVTPSDEVNGKTRHERGCAKRGRARMRLWPELRGAPSSKHHFQGGSPARRQGTGSHKGTRPQARPPGGGGGSQPEPGLPPRRCAPLQNIYSMCAGCLGDGELTTTRSDIPGSLTTRGVHRIIVVHGPRFGGS